MRLESLQIFLVAYISKEILKKPALNFIHAVSVKRVFQ